jgi:hypothetical protein
MSCEDCDNQDGSTAWPFRVGNKDIGYGTVLIIACEKHAKVVMEKLRATITCPGCGRSDYIQPGLPTPPVSFKCGHCGHIWTVQEL